MPWLFLSQGFLSWLSPFSGMLFSQIATKLTLPPSSRLCSNIIFSVKPYPDLILFKTSKSSVHVSACLYVRVCLSVYVCLSVWVCVGFWGGWWKEFDWNQSQTDWQHWRRNKKKLSFCELSRNRKILRLFLMFSSFFLICKIHSHSFPFSLQQIFRIDKKTFYVASGEAGKNQQDVGRIWPYPQ